MYQIGLYAIGNVGVVEPVVNDGTQSLRIIRRGRLLVVAISPPANHHEAV